jgi:hypothetical protein
MPDSAQLDMGGGGGGSSKGVPGWVMVVGAIAGVAGLALLLKGSGSGTTAAGTSINAALGSIQEENMNLLGTTQAGFMQTTNQFGVLGGQVGAGFANIATALANLSTQMSGLQSSFDSYSTQTQTNFDSLTGLIQSGQASQDQVNQRTTALLSSISQDVQSGLITQEQALQTLGQLQQQVATSTQQLQGSQTAQYNSLYALGQFLNDAMGSQFGGINYQLGLLFPHGSAQVGSY